MNHILFVFYGYYITPWKIIGTMGAFVFAGRWFVQLYISRKAKRSVLNKWFWLLSLTGSLLLLSYFIFGKNDSVGIISNSFPMFVALYNLSLEFRHHRKMKLQQQMLD